MGIYTQGKDTSSVILFGGGGEHGRIQKKVAAIQQNVEGGQSRRLYVGGKEPAIVGVFPS